MDCGGNKNETTKHRKHAPEDRGPEASLPGPIHPSFLRTVKKLRGADARSHQKKKKNKEKDAQPEKIKRKIVFSDLRNPPKNFTPLFGEVAKFRTLTKKEEQ